MFDRFFTYLILVSYTAYFTKADYYECNEPLIDKAALSATSSLPDRGPSNAKINGDSAWSPLENTYYQSLTADLGYRKLIHLIATKGRSNTLEYVTEYIVQYSDDGQQWKTVTDPDGDYEMFKGNVNGNSIRKNTFEVPIIAQWIRVNPTRWRDRIALRLELYGYAQNLHFNGSSMLKLDLKNEPISATRETVRFRFKTTMADGVLMYSRGSQGDYIALQLRHNRMLFNIDLGSGLTTSLSVGSLLDDNIWHDVVISRNRRDIVFSVDRVMIHGKIKGDFSSLNLNRDLFIGGVPNAQEGLIVVQNYTGCIENFYLNSTNIIAEMREGYDNGEDWIIKKYTRHNTLYSCPEPPIIPVTFQTRNSHAKLKGYSGINSLNVSFAFRTYEENGLLVFHKFTSSGEVRLFLEEGKIKISVKSGDFSTMLDNYLDRFDDGRWHQVIMTISKDSLVLNVDSKPMRTVRKLTMVTGDYYYIGGGVKGTPGFLGCMRLISVDGNYKLPTDWKDDEFCCQGEVVFDSCQMSDKCNPNPCEHGGICTQNSFEFFCNCQNTGYSGAVCHTSISPLSCEAYKNAYPVGERADIKIDIDGSGPLDPFPVTCEYYSDGRIVSVVHHSNEDSTPVDGFQEEGSFKQDIIYDADFKQLEALTNRSSECSQYLYYKCRQSKLFNSPSREGEFRPYSWWVSRNNQKMDYWGESVSGSRKCHCGIMGNCIDETKWCNCDAGLESWQVDEGELRDKEQLPVRQLRFGDTGNPLDDKQGYYRLGPLLCEGDDLLNNVITFRISDASIELPTFDMGHSGDIYLEFKTTTENAVILHAKGPSDYIKLAILGGDKLQFSYQAGSIPLIVSVETSYKLNDDTWHTVVIERNRKEARIIVNGALKSEIREPVGPVRALHLNSKLVIGSTIDFRDGFTGCMRSLLLNGKVVDLKSFADLGLYGISSGCVGKCASNPCLNNGTCHEKYDGYWCDCRYTAFKGPICGDEIGVNLRSDSMVKYDFMGSWRSTLSEKIRVGFTTTNPKGFLLGFFSNITGEYLTISVSNSGHLRVVFDFGFERREIIFPNKHFGLGQYHDVRLSRKNAGSTMLLQVDNYEPKEFHFDVKASADAQFNNIQYLYIGRNESMNEGFIGCVSRVEFDDIYPLKLLFQEDGPSNVRSIGGALTEDFCGVEPFTHPPNEIETRPPPDLDQSKIDDLYGGAASAVVGGIVSAILIILLIIAFLLARYYVRHKGEYLTQEDKGAEMALDPDEAVMESTTGHQVQKKREWFI